MRINKLLQKFVFKIEHNVFVYGTLFWFSTKLAKENEPEENPQDFPSTHKVNNGLYTLLATVFIIQIHLFRFLICLLI